MIKISPSPTPVTAMRTTPTLALLLVLILAAPMCMHAQLTSATSQSQQSSAKQALASGVIPAVNGAPSIAPEGLSDLKLSPGSMVNIHVFEEPDLDGTYRLDEHGQISVPYAGTIRLDSMTLTQAESAIASKLVAEDILKAPHVVVNIDEYNAQNIVVIGEVNVPGRYPVLTARKLTDVLAMAGGQTALAGNEVVIHRRDQPTDLTETVQYGRNTPLQPTVNPGDTVLVKRAGIVYVLGAVNRAGGYVMQEAGELNVIQALALALGIAPEAKVSAILVIRKLPDGSLTESRIDYNKLNRGVGQPMQLHAEDIVYVPPSAVKSVLFRATGVAAAATSATIYALH